jgi:hypothetical protein
LVCCCCNFVLFTVLEVKLSASCMLQKCFTTKLYLPAPLKTRIRNFAKNKISRENSEGEVKLHKSVSETNLWSS